MIQLTFNLQSTFFYFIIILFSLSYKTAFAQKNTEVEKVVNTYYENFSGYTKGKVTEYDFLSILTDTSAYNITIHGVENPRITVSGQGSDIMHRLNQFIDAGITIDFQILKREAIYSDDSLAIYSLKILETERFQSSLIVQSIHQNRMTLKKRDKDWQIDDISSVVIEQKRFKGACLCEIFESYAKSGAVVMKVTTQEVNGYMTQFHSLNNMNPENGTVIFKIGSYYYQWEENGTLWALTQDHEKDQQLGMVQAVDELVKVILQDKFYGHRCLEILMKNRLGEGR